MNSFFNWSYNDAASSDIPDSVYTAKISSINLTTSKNDNPMWEITLSLKELPHSHIRVFQVIGGNYPSNIIAMFIRNIAKMAKCFNVPEGSMNIEDWLGKCGYIRSFHKELDNGAVFINVKEFLTPEKGRAELFNELQKKQAEAFFANPPSAPNFNINTNGFNSNHSSDAEQPHDFNRNAQSLSNNSDDWGV